MIDAACCCDENEVSACCSGVTTFPDTLYLTTRIISITGPGAPFIDMTWLEVTDKPLNRLGSSSNFTFTGDPICGIFPVELSCFDLSWPQSGYEGIGTLDPPPTTSPTRLQKLRMYASAGKVEFANLLPLSCSPIHIAYDVEFDTVDVGGGAFVFTPRLNCLHADRGCGSYFGFGESWSMRLSVEITE